MVNDNNAQILAVVNFTLVVVTIFIEDTNVTNQWFTEGSSTFHLFT